MLWRTAVSGLSSKIGAAGESMTMIRIDTLLAPTGVGLDQSATPEIDPI